MMSTQVFCPRLSFIVIIIATTLCLNACDITSTSLKRPNVTPLSPRLHSVFQETKIVCFSHFTIEVPASATVVYGPAEAEAPISHYPNDGDKIAQRVTEKLAEIEKDRKFLSNKDIVKLPMFGKVIDGAVQGQKLVFGSQNQVGYSVSSFIPIGTSLFVQHLDGVYQDDDAFKVFNTVASHLRVRPEGEIPLEAGTCLDGGFLPLPLSFERVTLGVRLKEFPDVHFSVEVHKNQDRLPEFSDLDTRLKSAENDGGNWYTRVTFFRRSPRQLGDWKGFEALALKPAQENSKESHEFHFISLGAVNAPLQPELDIQLDTGASGHSMGAVKPSLSDEEAVALWDKLLSSIKIRPVASEKANAVVKPKTPLASLVATGGTCPESGWWQCTEGDNVEGGRRRHFTAGESMPHAILLGPPTLWQKLTRDRPKYQTATVWRLVVHDEPPKSTSCVEGGGIVPPAAAEQPPSSSSENSADDTPRGDP